MRRALLLLFAVSLVVGCRDKPSSAPPATAIQRPSSSPADRSAPSAGASANGAWKPVQQIGEDRPAAHAKTLVEPPKQ